MRYILVFILLFSINACSPRGESKTLAEIVAIAKKKFTEVFSSTTVEPSKKDMLVSLQKSLDQLLALDESEKLSEHASSIEKELLKLVSSAGYTSRPSMNELAKQYQGLVDGKKLGKEAFAARKLLAARTLTLLANELETTRFSVNQ